MLRMLPLRAKLVHTILRTRASLPKTRSFSTTASNPARARTLRSPSQASSVPNANSATNSSFWTRGECTIDGERSASLHHQNYGNRDRQQVILEAFALLLSCPIHEETDVTMHHEDCDHHVAEDAKGGDAPECANNE